MPPVLALDFDGVISNSAPEAFVVALRTYVSMKPETPLADSLARAEAASPSLETVEAHALYADFLDRMPLGNRAEDYAVVLASLEAGRELADQSAYDEFRTGFDESWLREYHGRFYRERAGFAAKDPAGWRALMRPYAPFVAMLKRRSGDAELCIATAKDRTSVRELLREYGIEDLFPNDRVLDKETGVSKSQHLQRLKAMFGCGFDSIVFIDDKVNHLDAVAPLGVRCVLAAWGFNGPRELVRARAAGHLVCTLEDVETRIFARSR